MNDAPHRRSLRHSRNEVRKAAFFIGGGFVVLTFVALLGISVNIDGPSRRRDRAQVDARNIEKAAELYVQRTGQLPVGRDALRDLVKAGVLETLPLDPWGNPYTLSVASDGQAEVSSLGADGQQGGAGNDQDLVRRFQLVTSPR